MWSFLGDSISILVLFKLCQIQILKKLRQGSDCSAYGLYQSTGTDLSCTVQVLQCTTWDAMYPYQGSSDHQDDMVF